MRAPTAVPLEYTDGWTRPARPGDDLPASQQLRRCDSCGLVRHRGDGASSGGDAILGTPLWVCRDCVVLRVRDVRARQASGERVVLDTEQRWSTAAQRLGVLVDGLVLNRYQAAAAGWPTAASRRGYR